MVAVVHVVFFKSAVDSAEPEFFDRFPNVWFENRKKRRSHSLQMTPSSACPLDPWVQPGRGYKHKAKPWNPHDHKDKGQAEEVNGEKPSPPRGWQQIVPVDFPGCPANISKGDSKQQREENTVKDGSGNVIVVHWYAGDSNGEACLVWPPTGNGKGAQPCQDNGMHICRQGFLHHSASRRRRISCEVACRIQHLVELSHNEHVQPRIGSNGSNNVERLEAAHERSCEMAS